MQLGTNTSSAVGKISIIRVKSEAFLSGGSIPKRHTAEGEDISPAIKWGPLPEMTAELALIVEDPNKGGDKPFVHWLIYKISPDEVGIPEGVQKVTKPEEPFGALQGRNSWETTGYRGPFPPKGNGVHQYHFKLYALDKELTLGSNAEKEALLRAMEGHVLGFGEIVGTYSR